MSKLADLMQIFIEKLKGKIIRVERRRKKERKM